MGIKSNRTKHAYLLTVNAAYGLFYRFLLAVVILKAMKKYEDNYGGIEEDLSLKSLIIWFIISLTFGLSPLLVMFL